jgi:hypothetical protein
LAAPLAETVADDIGIGTGAEVDENAELPAPDAGASLSLGPNNQESPPSNPEV